jgi:hypothetical protein
MNRRPIRDGWRRLRQMLPVSFAIAVTLLFGTADAWAKGANAEPVPAQSAPAQTAPASPATRLATGPSFEGSYASRETSTAGLEKFEGGDVVVITTTGLIIILLVVLIIVLL